MRTGTSYFTCKSAAVRYFAYEDATLDTIDRKISEGLIHIGKPEIKPGQRLVVIDGGARYAIEDAERLVTIPESTAVLIRKVFLPANPNKLRNRPGLQGDRLEQVRRACHDFIAAINSAKEG